MNENDIKTLKEKYIQDFNRAINIYEHEYNHEELIALLKTGSVVEKQTAVIKLASLNCREDANIFITNLTGCDGKIREAVSFRLKEFIRKNPEFFSDYYDIFLDAIIDINGNICRNTISAICYLKRDKVFCARFCPELIIRAHALSQIAKDFDIQDGKYKINKDMFKLYWYLETIYEFAEYIDNAELLKLLAETANIADYTIREKTAKIISKLKNPIFHNLEIKLKEDENYYVRRF